MKDAYETLNGYFTRIQQSAHEAASLVMEATATNNVEALRNARTHAYELGCAYRVASKEITNLIDEMVRSHPDQSAKISLRELGDKIVDSTREIIDTLNATITVEFGI